MFNNLYDQQEANSDLAKEQFTSSLRTITEGNIHAAFENLSKDKLVEMVLADKVWFKLLDRTVHIDDIESELSQHNEIMLDVIRGGKTIKDELEKIAYNAIDEVIADYEIAYVS